MASVAWFIRSKEDKVLSINGVPYNVKAKNMNGIMYPGFSMSYNPNPEGDLCKTGIAFPPITGVFKDDVTNEEYELESVNFIGGRPPTRPTS